MTRDVSSYLTGRHSDMEGTTETLEGARVTLSAVW
jgi:hypothetical protein